MQEVFPFSENVADAIKSCAKPLQKGVKFQSSSGRKQVQPIRKTNAVTWHKTLWKKGKKLPINLMYCSTHILVFTIKIILGSSILHCHIKIVKKKQLNLKLALYLQIELELIPNYFKHFQITSFKVFKKLSTPIPFGNERMYFDDVRIAASLYQGNDEVRRSRFLDVFFSKK